MALELAASIAGLISLVDLVVVKGSKFYSITKNALPEIQGLLQEGINLGSALYSLERSIKLYAAMEDKETSEEGNLHLYIDDCKRCVFELVEVMEKCGPKDFTKWEGMKASLKWSITASQTRELTQKIQRVKGTIMLSLEAKSLDALYKLLSNQASVRASLERIEMEQSLEARIKHKERLDARTKEILDWVSTYQTKKHTEMKRVRHPGTSEWYRDCEEYRDWLQTANSILWFYGIPGAGKSVLTSAVIEYLQLSQKNHMAIAYFYIEYSSEESQKFHTVVGTLIRQIAESKPQAIQILDEFESRFKGDFADLNFDQMIGLMKELSNLFSPMILVIDGLDESEGNERGEILRFLKTLGESPHGSIKAIATSRKHFDIQQMLAAFPSISIAARSTDVKMFVASELEKRLQSEVEFYGIRLQNSDLKAEIISTLVDRADGMFQWVRCQLDTLSRTPGDRGKRAALQNLPRNLPETYRRILRRVDESGRPLVRFTLAWMAIFARNGIDIDEVADIASHFLQDNITPRDIFLQCSSLITLTQYNSTKISHFSVLEFLETEEAKSQWYSISEMRNHPERTRDSITIDYMSTCYWNDKACKISGKPHLFQTSLTVRYYRLRGGLLKSSFAKSDEGEILMPKWNSLFSDSNSREWRNFAHNMLLIFQDRTSCVIRYMNPISECDIENSRLHIAYFLGLNDLAEKLTRENGCNLTEPILGRITPLHAGYFGYLRQERRGLEGPSASWVSNMIQLSDRIDFHLLIMFYYNDNYSACGTDIIGPRFRNWVSSNSEAHQEISDGLKYWLSKTYISQNKLIFECSPFWITLCASGLQPGCYREWLEIYIKTPYIFRTIRRKDRFIPESRLAFYQKLIGEVFESDEISALEVAGFFWYTRRHSRQCLITLLRLGIGHLLEPLAAIQFLEVVLSLKYRFFNGLRETLFLLLRTLSERSLINQENREPIFENIFRILETYEGEDYKDTDPPHIGLLLPQLPPYENINQLMVRLKSIGADQCHGIKISRWEDHAHRCLQITEIKDSRRYVRYIFEECLKIAVEGIQPQIDEIVETDLAVTVSSAPNNINIIVTTESSLEIQTEVTGTIEEDLQITSTTIQASSTPDAEDNDIVFVERSKLSEAPVLNENTSAIGLSTTPLGLAILNKQSQQLEDLLKDRADRYEVDEAGRTYLHLLVEAGSPEILDIFLRTPTWYFDALRETAVVPSPVLEGKCSKCGDSNMEFLMDVIKKGLEAKQLQPQLRGILPA